MCKITDIDDHRSPEYWRKRVEAIPPEEKMSVSFIELEEGAEDRIAFIRFFNLIDDLHKQDISMEDIFCGGLRALINKSYDLSEERELFSMIKRAHDEITRHYDTPCYERLGIDDVS